MFLKYFLIISFLVFLFKSAIRGLNSELISLVGTTIAATTAIMVYQPKMKYMFISAAIFCVIQALGLFLAFNRRQKGVGQFFGGMILGVFKFLLLLTVATSIALAMNLEMQEFLDNQMVQIVLPYAKKMQFIFAKFAQ